MRIIPMEAHADITIMKECRRESPAFRPAGAALMTAQRLAERHPMAMGLQETMTGQETGCLKSISVKRLAACPVWTEGAAMLIRRRRRADGILAGKGDCKDPEAGAPGTAPKKEWIQAGNGADCAAAGCCCGIYGSIPSRQTGFHCRSCGSAPYRYCDG